MKRTWWALLRYCSAHHEAHRCSGRGSVTTPPIISKNSPLKVDMFYVIISILFKQEMKGIAVRFFTSSEKGYNGKSDAEDEE